MTTAGAQTSTPSCDVVFGLCCVDSVYYLAKLAFLLRKTKTREEKKSIQIAENVEKK